MEHDHTDSLRARRRTLITGASGQLGLALAQELPEALALTREQWDVRFPLPDFERPTVDLVLHAAAWRTRSASRPGGGGNVTSHSARVRPRAPGKDSISA